MPTVGGSPEPERFQPALNAAVLPALTSMPSNSPGTTVVYLPGWTLTSVTFGLSLKRRIGYVTQSRLVIRSLFHVRLLVQRAGQALDQRAAHLVRDAVEADRDAVVLGDVGVLHDDLAGLLVDLDVGDDADLARRERAEAEAAAA